MRDEDVRPEEGAPEREAPEAGPGEHEEEQRSAGGEPEDEPAARDEGDGGAAEEEEEDGDEGYDKERALRTIRNLRQREKELSKALKELERENKRYQRQSQSAEERLQADLKEREERIAELEQQLERYRDRALEAAFARQVGYEPDTAFVAWRLLGEIGVKPEWDENERLKNAKEIRKALYQFSPKLFPAPNNADAGRRNGEGTAAADFNAMIRRAAGLTG